MQIMQAGVHQTTLKPLTEGTDAVFTACVEPAGLMFEAPACLSLLEAAELAGLQGLQLASSCRNGTCRTCICQLRSGQVTYRIEWPGLSFDEKREGFILPCVAYPASNVVMQLP
jgi:ferredoxin